MGSGPLSEHRLFNPDLPISLEAGIEAETGYLIASGFKVSAQFASPS